MKYFYIFTIFWTLATTRVYSYESKNTLNAHFWNASDNELAKVLDDPKDRINLKFKVPQGIYKSVLFWFKIYSKFSSYQTLVYDRDNPEHILSVIDNRDLFNAGRSPVVIELTIKSRIKKTTHDLKLALQALQKNPNYKFKDGSYGSILIKEYGRLKPKEWRRVEASLRNQPGQRDRIFQGIQDADPFFPPMEKIFHKFELPLELTRLPLVESSFNLRAVSKASAVGTWQFLKKSALEYLVVDQVNGIDERLSPVKSAYAAARMFKRNYKILGDYGMAIIAYNHGARNLIKIRHRFKGENISELLNLKHGSPLGYASKNYYSEFIALLYAERYRDVVYGLPYHEIGRSSEVSIVKMKKSVSIFDISSLYHISIHELRTLNPDIFNLKRKLPKGTRIVVPRSVLDSLVLNSEVEVIFSINEDKEFNELENSRVRYPASK